MGKEFTQRGDGSGVCQEEQINKPKDAAEDGIRTISTVPYWCEQRVGSLFRRETSAFFKKQLSEKDSRPFHS
ncbi:MAG TPA: hypothetical protein PK992_01600, partial [Planctomycetaceae bacterium]|nr:hypothetical protein [Planctomycetaceae bacterium]